MKLISLFFLLFFAITITYSQTINCSLNKLNSLDFFFGGAGDEKIIWPDSTIAEIENSLSDSIEENVAVQFLPLAMLEMQTYFEEGIQQTEFYRIIRYSKLFAAALKDSSWIITINDFCGGTNHMISRFNAWYSNDSVMTKLLYTNDRGPYFGNTLQAISLDDADIRDSIRIAESEKELFFGLSDDKYVVFTKNENNAIENIYTLLGDYHDDDVISLFAEVKCVPIKDFGYSVLLFTSDGACRLYLDKNGKLRFYYFI